MRLNSAAHTTRDARETCLCLPDRRNWCRLPCVGQHGAFPKPTGETGNSAGYAICRSRPDRSTPPDMAAGRIVARDSPNLSSRMPPAHPSKCTMAGRVRSGRPRASVAAFRVDCGIGFRSPRVSSKRCTRPGFQRRWPCLAITLRSKDALRIKSQAIAVRPRVMRAFQQEADFGNAGGLGARSSSAATTRDVFHRFSLVLYRYKTCLLRNLPDIIRRQLRSESQAQKNRAVEQFQGREADPSI